MTAAASTTAIPVTLGCMTFGEEGTSGARVHTVEACEEMVDIFQAHGHNEVDSAYMYCNGTSEEFLGKMDWKKRGLIMDTKLYPTKGANRYMGNVVSHSAADCRKYLDIQLKALKTDSIDMWYLHAPDRSVPFEETLKAVDDLYKEGKFKRFGISNFMAWEVAHVVGLCEANGWIKPTAYQGIYNAIHRNVEPELFPCLRKFGLSFYEFNPLGGGFFTGRWKRDEKVEAGSRFDGETGQGKNYRGRYWNDSYFDALELVKPIADKHNLTLGEVALRWVSHHSLMSREHGDNILIGASSKAHLEENLTDLEKGPLPKEVVDILDQAWLSVKAVSSVYYH